MSCVIREQGLSGQKGSSFGTESRHCARRVPVAPSLLPLGTQDGAQGRRGPPAGRTHVTLGPVPLGGPPPVGRVYTRVARDGVVGEVAPVPVGGGPLCVVVVHPGVGRGTGGVVGIPPTYRPCVPVLGLA